MATRNRTPIYKKHRDAVKSVRAPLSSSASGSGGPVIEMGSLLGSNRSSYAPLSTEDPGPSRYVSLSFFCFVTFSFGFIFHFLVLIWLVRSGGTE